MKIIPLYVHLAFSPRLKFCIDASITDPRANPNKKLKKIESRLNIHIGGITLIEFNLCIRSKGLANAFLNIKQNADKMVPNHNPVILMCELLFTISVPFIDCVIQY